MVNHASSLVNHALSLVNQNHNMQRMFHEPHTCEQFFLTKNNCFAMENDRVLKKMQEHCILVHWHTHTTPMKTCTDAMMNNVRESVKKLVPHCVNQWQKGQLNTTCSKIVQCNSSSEESAKRSLMSGKGSWGTTGSALGSPAGKHSRNVGIWMQHESQCRSSHGCCGCLC